ncbi:hypothetical protein LguiA_015492 [Lonicera macranthoides]
MTVGDIINPASKEWNTSIIDHVIPMVCKNDILNTPLPYCTSYEDTPSWSKVSSGKFSIKSCYDAITEENGSEEENWLWLWKIRIPRKLNFFLWTIRHGKNLCNHQRMMRGMNTMGDCKFCGGLENNDHIFRYCYKANEVWNSCRSNLILDNHANVDFKTWLDTNVKNSQRDDIRSTANTFFIFIIWSLWKAKNKFEFDNKLMSAEDIKRESTKFARSVLNAYILDSKPPSSTQNLLINWKFPPAGIVKINTDGSCLGNPGPAGFGGVARDNQGNWLEGFAGFIGKATILKAELWAVREAMMLIKRKHWLYAIVEVDSSNVCDLLKGEDVEEHPLKVLIQDCKSIMMELKLSVHHTLREGNRCADAMAKLGVNQMEKLEVFHHVPSVVKGILEADAMGVSFPRGS